MTNERWRFMHPDDTRTDEELEALRQAIQMSRRGCCALHSDPLDWERCWPTIGKMSVSRDDEQIDQDF